MESSSELTSAEEGSKRSPFDDMTREDLIKKCKGLLVIAQKSKQSKAELQSEVESYKLQFEKCESERKTSYENVVILQELVDSLTEQKLNYITELDSAQNKVKLLTQKIKDFEDEVAKLKSNLIVQNESITENSLKISTLEIENTSVNRQNKILVEENEQLITQLTELENRIEEFNKIGLQQRQQLQLLEETVNTGKSCNNECKGATESLNIKIRELESQLHNSDTMKELKNTLSICENKIREVTQLYESEKDKKEKANVKLRSYKDKILKCASCINQLKNSRYILYKTIKEYSESIPKWQNDIIKASKLLDSKINDLSQENDALKLKLQELEKNIHEFTGFNQKDSIDQNCIEKQKLVEKLHKLQNEVDVLLSDKNKISNELIHLKADNEALNKSDVALKDEKKYLSNQVDELTEQLSKSLFANSELTKSVNDLETKNKKLSESLQTMEDKNGNSYGNLEKMVLQIKALESEKAILVKEKMNAKDNLTEKENRNQQLTEKIQKLTADLHDLNDKYAILNDKKHAIEMNASKQLQHELQELKNEYKTLQETHELIRKEHENQIDLNGILKDEVEMLKLSLEEPKDDNLSDLNVSLQTDIVKLETKLAAYKQENASLLAEIKESRNKIKESNAILSEYEEMKSKLSSYKTENTELLNEMKEINQVLRERGEAISKLEKAISESERLIETMENDREEAKKEKENLLMKINDLEVQLSNAEKKGNETSDIIKQILSEKDNAVKSAAEKDIIISNLKEEIERLIVLQNQSTSFCNEDNMSTSTTSKLEEHSQMKDLDDTFEEKYTKLRLFALKLKKKLNETTVQLQNAEQDKAKLEKIINENAGAAKTLSTDEVDSCGNTKNLVTNTKVIELEDKVKSLTDNLNDSKQVVVEYESLKVELASKCQQLQAEIEAHKATKDSLEKARRDVKKRSVLSLEMEDYERSMKELTNKMEDNVKKMQQMESTIDTQEGTITAMKTQIKLLEEQIKSEETQNRLIREDLHKAIEDNKEKDNVIQDKNETISKLELALEDEKRRSEESNIEMTSLFAEKEKVIINLSEEKIELNSRLKKMEFKCADIEEKLKITNIELEDLKTDYASYKVRAQSVLRQNQTVDHSQEEQLKEEAAAMRTQVESLTLKLHAAHEKIDSLQAAAESEKRRASEAANEASRAAQRTARLQGDVSRLTAQMEAERAQHKLQISTLTQCYKAQITELENKLHKETDELKRQLALEQESHKAVVNQDKVNSDASYMLPVISKDEGSDGEMDINVSMLPREEGEGSESAPSPPLSKSFLAGGSRSPVPLDRLLDEGVPENEALDSSGMVLTPEQEVADVRRKLLAQQQRVKHVTLLLAESERECARYLQMNDLLKAEIRRARGSLERTQHAHNAEYMKNVTLKFVTLPPGDERSRLVPVLQKILTLTPEETQKIYAVAKGMDPNPGKGWGSYLPWPGGK